MAYQKGKRLKTYQGEPWGPIDCSLHVDGKRNESLDSSLEPYKYKEEV